jgi:hypothetical protein
MPKANRGFRLWWLKRSFQLYWQAKCLQWFSRQVTFTFDTQQVIITHKLFGIVYHQDHIKREAIERAITGLCWVLPITSTSLGFTTSPRISTKTSFKKLVGMGLPDAHHSKRNAPQTLRFR